MISFGVLTENNSESESIATNNVISSDSNDSQELV